MRDMSDMRDMCFVYDVCDVRVVCDVRDECNMCDMRVLRNKLNMYVNRMMCFCSFCELCLFLNVQKRSSICISYRIVRILFK